MYKIVLIRETNCKKLKFYQLNIINKQSIKMNNPTSNTLCCFCKKDVGKYGNNPEPLFKYPARCCDSCNATIVIMARIREMQMHNNK
jgi:hypothetical protein